MGKRGPYVNIYILLLALIACGTLYSLSRKELFQEEKKYRLAFYTCFYGTNNNVAFKIPPLPSEIYDCYYYTNNRDLLKEIEKTKWKGIYDEKPVSADSNISTMQGKYVKTLPHNVDPIKNYEYTCFLDSKLGKLSETFITKAIEDYFIKGSYALLLREHEFIKENVWNEYSVSMGQERYRNESDRIKSYIDAKLEEGWSEKTDRHCQCGLLIRNMKHPKTSEINETWYAHIQECGIQDQISFFFVKQEFNEYIFPFSENPFV